MLSRFPRIFLAVLAGFAASAPAQFYSGQTLVAAKLVADTSAIVPGKPFRIGLVLKMAPRWHTYWQYPGDAGIPTKIDWKLPEGFAAGPIEWPLPKADLEPGNTLVYVYGDEVMLMQTLSPPKGIDTGSLTLKGKASWLVCEETCVPGDAEVSLTLPVAPTSEPANQGLFEKWSARLPSTDAPPFAVEWMRKAGVVSGKIAAAPGMEAVDFYPLPTSGQTVGHPKTAGSATGGFTVEISASGEGELRGVLAVTENGLRRGWLVQAGSTPATGTAPAGGADARAMPPGQIASLWLALVYAFLGGLVLNLMPCVLPVISLKIFGFVRQAGRSPRHILLHGIAFAAGVYAWFLAIAAVVIAIRLGGGDVVWSFQFQNSWFVIVITTVVFVFALNLFGVFEITLPGKASNTLAQAGAGEGLGGSFFQGAFATLLSTPCTAPFLGAALSYAFAQPPWKILVTFCFIATGMALPYLLLSANPAWLRFLPKPGAWMERLKQFMGFPLMATVIWLLYVVGSQRGLLAGAWIAAFLLCAGIACWIYGIASSPGVKARSRRAGVWIAAAVAIAAGWIFVGKLYAAEKPISDLPAASTDSDGIPWEPYSKARVDSLLAEGKPVFIDFTASWCITCKYNERTAINIPEVREKIAELGIVPIRADLTNGGREVTAELKKFSPAGAIPFYVLYPANGASNPVIFPTILTPSLVLEKLSQARPVSSQ